MSHANLHARQFAGLGAELLVDPADAAGLMAKPLLETLRIYTPKQ